MAGGRSSPVPEFVMLKSSQDQTQDANTALWELEKGLRSGKVEEQCEAIVRFPALFAKYPFPILVNSAFLKLADVFRGGTNFLKLCVLKVIQESVKHLDKILNVDEIVRRLYTVIHANDPVARAITLRVFGSISSIISDRKNIHYSIRNSLDSHDQVEVEAAIFATKAFCKQSRQFAEGIFHKIAEMIEGLSTPIEMKLKLIPAFQFMNRDLKAADEVQELCLSLLKAYPATDFVLVTLQTLTQLAMTTFINIPSQVDILIRYAKCDPRNQVKFGALRNLRELAVKGPHLWTEEHVEELSNFAVDALSDKSKLAALDVLCCLSKSVGKTKCFSKKAIEIQEHLSDSFNIDCATLAAAIRTNILVCKSKEGINLPSDQLTKLENDLQLLTALCLAENSMTSLKRCLRSIASVTMVSSNLKSSLTLFLIEMLSGVTGDCFLEICHCLVRTGTSSSVDLQKHRAKLLEYISEAVKEMKTSSDDKILVALVTLLLQAGFGSDKAACVALQNDVILKLKDVKESNLWTCYRIGRQAARLGFPLLASNMFDSLVSKLSSESNYMWMKALANIMRAEYTLMTPCSTQAKTLEQLTEAYNLYQEGLVDLKASVTVDHALYFQYKFAKLRAEMLHAYSQLVICCCSLRTCPPPAIAMAASLATGQEVHQLSRLGTQSCVKSFAAIANGLGSLYRMSFNADPSTLEIIQAVLSSELSNSLVKSRSSESHRHIQALTAMNQNIIEIVESLATQVKDSPVCHIQTQCLCQAIATQIETPIPYPTFFFRSLQLTTIKLAVSPSSKSVHDPVLVNVDTQLALKVEGLIENGSKPDFFRNIHSACIMVKVKAIDGSKPSSADTKPKLPTSLVLQDMVQPHNEYFSSQFLLSFNTSGQHELLIVASVKDDTGALWETGPQVITYVDVIEHGVIRRSGIKP
eukprot:gene3271-1602_t